MWSPLTLILILIIPLTLLTLVIMTSTHCHLTILKMIAQAILDQLDIIAISIRPVLKVLFIPIIRSILQVSILLDLNTSFIK